MRMPKTLVTAASAVAILLSSPIIFPNTSTTVQAGDLKRDKRLRFIAKKVIAWHVMPLKVENYPAILVHH